MTKQEILNDLNAAESGGARRAKVAITDIDGILRGKYVSIDKLKSALDGGFGFCDVVFGWDMADECYDNAKYTGWQDTRTQKSGLTPRPTAV